MWPIKKKRKKSKQKRKEIKKTHRGVRVRERWESTYPKLREKILRI